MRPYEVFTYVAETHMLRFHAQKCVGCGNREHTEIDPATFYPLQEDE